MFSVVLVSQSMSTTPAMTAGVVNPFLVISYLIFANKLVDAATVVSGTLSQLLQDASGFESTVAALDVRPVRDVRYGHRRPPAAPPTVARPASCTSDVPFAITDDAFVPTARYHDPTFYALEGQGLWRHVWQPACRLDEIPDPGNVRVATYVNGLQKQDASTADWIFPIPVLIEFLTRVVTLEPGDVVSTGTPAGIGYFRDPPEFLEPGDEVTIEAEGIGRLTNPVVAGW